MKQLLKFSSLYLLLLLLTGCQNNIVSDTSTINTVSTAQDPPVITESFKNEANPLDLLTIDLPADITRKRISDVEEHLLGSTGQVGGILLIQIDDEVFEDVLNYSSILEPIILDTLKEATLFEWEWHGGNSSIYGIYEFNVGDSQSEYIAYTLRGHTTCYVVWFDRSQVSYELETKIMDSLSSEDITQELNMVSTEEYMNAISESMAKEEYSFKMDLPEGITREDTSDSSALLYKDGEVIGGYNVVHFEKGILPNVKNNHEIILTYLQENVMKSISNSTFDAQITDERLITAVFSNGNDEYTHFLLPFGQIGIQYDLWFNTTRLENQTVQSILLSAGLEQIS